MLKIVNVSSKPSSMVFAFYFVGVYDASPAAVYVVVVVGSDICFLYDRLNSVIGSSSLLLPRSLFKFLLVYAFICF